MRKLTYLMLAGVAVGVLISCQQQGKGSSHGSALKDSDDYYMQLVDRGVKYYQAYAVDSFVQTNQQIHQYLLRNEGRNDHAIKQLHAHWLKAQGVYYAALASKPDSGIIYTEEALQMMEQERMDPELRVITMLNRGDFYRQAGRFDMSADSYLRAMAVADSFQTSEDSRIAIYLGISTVYTFMDDFTHSAEWYQRCEQLLPKMSKPDQFIYYNNRGNDYYFQERYQEALPCFEKAAALVKDNPDKTWDYYTARTNIAEILINLKKAEEARPIVAEVDSFFHHVNFGILIYYVETEKMKLALLDGKTQDAVQMIQQEDTPEEMIPAAKVMRLKTEEQAWLQTGNAAKAYQAHLALHAINDSIKTANMRMQMSTRLLEYEHDKRLLEQQQQIDHSRMTSRLAWALFATALMTVILLFVLYMMRRRKASMQALELRQQLIETRLRNTRNRLSPHFIYNALTHEMLAQQDGKTVNFNTLTQLLRRGLAIADTLTTTLEEELAFVDYYATIEGQQMGEEFKYERQVDEGIDMRQVILPAMTIQIFAENAIKHGLRPMRPQKGQQRLLTIHVSRQGDATLVEVLDNGEGLKKATSGKGHTGMKVVRQTIQMLNEKNEVPIQFGVGNYEREGVTGCRSWILLPDSYNYTLTTT
ncbi:MAG: tetratricopeptide repeat protein [Prevotella sp.]|nr:tetratricopeptide repeat protein [Prevotella sp.]